MEFLKQSDIDSMPLEERDKFWFSLYKKGENAFMFFEGFFFFILLVSFVSTIEFPPKIAAFGWVAMGGVLLIGIVCILFLVALQQVSFAEFIRAWGTPSLRDDWFKGLTALVIMIAAVWADAKGGAAFLNHINSYDAQIVSKYEDDRRVSTNQTDIARIEKERDGKIKTMACTECSSVRAEYSVKIAKKKAQLRAKEWEAAWKKTENDNIRREISLLESEREAKVLVAQGRFESRRDSVRNSYDIRVNTLDTTVNRLKAQIDSSNLSEQNKTIERERENHRYGGGLSWLTQIVLLIVRFQQVRKWRKAGREFVAIGEFMATTAVLNVWFERIGIEWNKYVEKRRIDNIVRYAEAFQNVDNYALEKSTGNEILKAMLDAGVKTASEAQIFYNNMKEKNVSNSAQSIGNQDEKDIILQLIEGLKTSILFESDPDIISETESIIAGLEISLIF